MIGDRGTEALNRIGERIKVLEEERDRAYEKGWRECRAVAAVIITGDVLERPDEFYPKIKLKVFNLLDKLADKIRSLQPPSEAGRS